jgi:hypothetical protein
MKLGGKCGAMYVVARDLKAELLDKLDTISTQQLECLQVRCITGLRHSTRNLAASSSPVPGTEGAFLALHTACCRQYVAVKSDCCAAHAG